MAFAYTKLTNDLLTDRLYFDAIIIGAGAAGSIAAALFARMGIRVLVLDAGLRSGFLSRPYSHALAHGVRYLARPGFYRVLPPKIISAARKGLKLFGSIRQPRQCRFFAWELDPMSLVDDRNHPYTTSPGTDFAWFRAHGVNGRMTVPGHGRQYNRITDRHFSGERGAGPQWPISGAEMAPWYDRVSDMLGLDASGEQTPPMTSAEAALAAALQERWPDLAPELGRSADWPARLVGEQPADNVLLREGASVKQVDVDASGRLEGVTWIDAETRSEQSAKAPIVFVCASTIESTRILLNSKSKAFPDGIGADGGALGKYLMDHVLVSAQGIGPGLPGGEVKTVEDRCIYAARMHRHADSDSAHPFGVQIYRSPLGDDRSMLNCVSFAEMAPEESNQVTLHSTKRDANGVPVVNIEFRHSETEHETARAQSEVVREIAEIAGAQLHDVDLKPAVGGSAVHECGTARMGDKPKGSVLNPNNEVWDVPRLYVTDGASFPSIGPHSLTLTIMALTARAVAHATGDMADARKVLRQTSV